MTETDPQPTDSSDGVDVDVIVIGAGHNGLVTAAYLARAGVRTLLLEARSDVGGTASSETFGGATVNICNCDHITFRTTPVLDELRLGDHGLTYVDIEPAQHSLAWSGGPAWSHSHDLDTTLDSIGRAYPHEVDGYRRYARAAIPAVEMILDAANEPPTAAGLTRLAIRRRFAGAPTIMRWSRRSAADVLRSFFSEDALLGPAVVTGPMVWGISPELRPQRPGRAHPRNASCRQRRPACRWKRRPPPCDPGGLLTRRRPASNVCEGAGDPVRGIEGARRPTR